MKTPLYKIKTYVIAHKIISAIMLIMVLFVGNWAYRKITSTTGEARYITSKVTKGTIVSAVTGSGQVSASNQIDIKSKVAGMINYVGIKPGDRVERGKTLFYVDSTDTQKAIRDAEISFASAQISLDKLKNQNSNENMNADLAKAYDDGFDTVSNVFLDLPGIMTGLNDMFFKSDSRTGQLNVDWYKEQVANEDRDEATIFKQNFIDSYNKAKTAYDTNFDKYKIVFRTSDHATVESLILQTYNTTKLISDAIKNANNYIDLVNSSMQKSNTDIPIIITTHKSTLNTDTSKTNTHLTSLVSVQTNIKDNKDAFPNASLDIQSSELSLKQKANALQDAKDKLLDYAIRAPFSGTIASVPVQKGDSVGSGTTLGTIITTQQMATISLNEVDIAKIKLEQKVTLTFDAVTDLTITGKVAQIDSVGTVSQGVVNYNVKISFDTNDDRIKPGMSVSAAVIISVKQDILTVPNSAVKNQGSTTYVEMFDAPLPLPLAGVQGSTSITPPRQQDVVVGVSNDTSTEIISGIKEGDEIVSRTILPTTTSTTAPSIFGAATNRSGSTGGTVRIPTTGR